jgi:Putative zinc-finger
MAGQGKNGMQCSEFDALLVDALDENLSGEKLESFRAHARVCANCGPLFADVEAGRRWMKSLAQVEPPVNLVHNILVATTGQEGTGRTRVPATSFKDALFGWLRPAFGILRQPRFAMSFGMAFFSLSMTFSIAGVRLSSLRHVDLRPSAIRRTYYETQGRVVKYYENIRFVYEMESRVRDLKRATTPAQPAPEPNKERKNRDNTSGQPEPRQERNYSQWENRPVLAALPGDQPVGMGTTCRRIV